MRNHDAVTHLARPLAGVQLPCSVLGGVARRVERHLLPPLFEGSVATLLETVQSEEVLECSYAAAAPETLRPVTAWPIPTVVVSAGVSNAVVLVARVACRGVCLRSEERRVGKEGRSRWSAY